MDKLSLLFDAKLFAGAFDAARDNSRLAQREADAVIWLEAGVAVAGAGFACGYGQLNHYGSKHDFGVSNQSISNVAAGRIYATGRVKQQRRIADFSGHYRASAGGGEAIAGGALYIVELVTPAAKREI